MSESLRIDSPLWGLGMPKAYSRDLRERVIEAVETGASRREAAEETPIRVLVTSCPLAMVLPRVTCTAPLNFWTACFLLLTIDIDRHSPDGWKQAEEALLKAGALQRAIFNSANFSSIATDAKGVIQIFNVGAERMLGYAAADVMNKITPADISDPQELIARAKALSIEIPRSRRASRPWSSRPRAG
jgi:PAS domain-containing protein